MIMYVHLPDFFQDHPEIIEIRITPAPAMNAGCLSGTKEVKELTKHLTHFGKKVKPEVTWSDFVELWSSACDRNPEWTRVTERNKDLQKRFTAASKEFTKKSDWELIIKGMEMDQFFSGKSGKYDRPKAITLFYDSRYFTFYESALNAPKKQNVDSILDELKELL